jgi:hypothetical protein
MIQAELFNVGDLVRTHDSDYSDDSGDLFTIRNIEIHGGSTRYRLESLGAPWDDAVSTRWASHDELQPAEN